MVDSIYVDTPRSIKFILGLAAMIISLIPIQGLFAQSKTPACPAGSQPVSFKDSARPYIRHECKLLSKTNNMEMCREWNGDSWSPANIVPCGSRVSFDVEYTGTLRCPVSEQVYLWDEQTNSLSKDISCLPPNWGTIQGFGSSCPAGYRRGTPALFGQDTCYGPRKSANRELLARDINGYALDMTIQQVERAANQRLISLGGGQYKLSADGIEYDLGFSVLGHLFRIDSEQNLGYFVPDEPYTHALTSKLTAKFGAPQSNQLPGGPMTWEFLETYREGDGPAVNRTTVSLSALLMDDGGEPTTLHLKLMDFRIARRDLAIANVVPRSRAEQKTKF